MAPLGLVIGVGEGPANFLWPGPGDAEGDPTTGADNAHDLSDGRLVGENMLQHFGAEHAVEAAILEGEVERAALQEGDGG